MFTRITPAWHVELTKVTSAALPDSNFTEDCLHMQILPLNTLSATLCNKLEMKNDSPSWLDLQEKWKQQTNKQNPEGYMFISFVLQRITLLQVFKNILKLKLCKIVPVRLKGLYIKD